MTTAHVILFDDHVQGVYLNNLPTLDQFLADINGIIDDTPYVDANSKIRFSCDYEYPENVESANYGTMTDAYNKLIQQVGKVTIIFDYDNEDDLVYHYFAIDSFEAIG